MKKLIVANWKMHGNHNKIVEDITNYANNAITNQANVVLALPVIYIPIARQILDKIGNTNIKLAAQDVSKFLSYGAYTGEVGANMLKEFGVDYVIVGHSERRMFFHESNHTMAKKIDAAIINGIMPIFCFGEEIWVREKNKHLEVINEQLQLLHLIEVPIKNLILAYEPIWAIGSGRVPTNLEIMEVVGLVHGFVQNYLSHAKITTLYGGSVSSSNVESILSIAGNNGVLVGGASLHVDEFSKICSFA